LVLFYDALESLPELLVAEKSDVGNPTTASFDVVIDLSV
jgi:hypothetical protein